MMKDDDPHVYNSIITSYVALALIRASAEEPAVSAHKPKVTELMPMRILVAMSVPVPVAYVYVNAGSMPVCYAYAVQQHLQAFFNKNSRYVPEILYST